jgi:Fe-S-cluster containining protein
MIRHDSDGYCHHLERQTTCCGIYAQRPIVCRAYDCRNDKRIWADFERKIVSPELDNLFQQSGSNGHQGTTCQVAAVEDAVRAL